MADTPEPPDNPTPGPDHPLVTALRQAIDDPDRLLQRRIGVVERMSLIGSIAQILVVAGLLVSTIFLVRQQAAIRDTQTHNAQVLHILQDATTPGGKLYQQSQKQTATAIQYLVQALGTTATGSRAQIIRCVDNHLDVLLGHGANADPTCQHP
jgi:hypothetical protein